MKIAVFGLGYVGCVTAACFAKLGHKVIGVDVIKRKVQAINRGEAPIKEKGLDALINKGFREGNLKATTDVFSAIEDSEIAFICVGTPSARDGSVELSFLKKVITEIMKAVNKKYIIVIRSTIPPGTFQKISDTAEKVSGKKLGKDLDIVLNPEFMREGSAIDDFFNPPFIVISTENRLSARKVSSVYKGVKAKIFIVKPKIAEMIKYASNSFHALKIVFANEIGMLCKGLGIDSNKLMGLFCEDKQLNLSPYYLMPGFAYGGSCLPKEIASLQHNSRLLKLNLPLIWSISTSNYEHINRAAKLIKKQKKKNVGILGITFKKNTDDIRGNPILLVVNKLLDAGFNVRIYDPNIKKENLKNIESSYRKTVYDIISKRDLKQGVKKIGHLFCSLEEILKKDVLVISNRDSELLKIAKKLGKNQILIDLQRVINPKDIKAKYLSLC